MKENIEKDIELIEKFNYGFLSASRLKLNSPIIMSIDDNINNSIMNILSEYKRVLKENEELLEVKISAGAHNRILELEKRNKELEKSDASKEDYTIRLYAEKKELKDQLKDSIPKDKIREKIEEIQTLIDEMKENEEASKYKVDKNYWHENKMRYVYKRNILKELLEE